MDPKKVAAAVPAVLAVLEAFQDPKGERAARKIIPRYTEFKDKTRSLVANTADASVSFAGMGLRDAHVVYGGLAAALRGNTTTLNLDMSANPGIGDEGWVFLAKALGQNKALTSWTIKKCGMTGAGAVALAAALSETPTLITLDLEGNPIDREGMSALAPVLGRSAALTSLNLTGSAVDTDGVAAYVLASALYGHTALKAIKCGNKLLSEPVYRSNFLRLAANDPQLTSINLSGKKRNKAERGRGEAPCCPTHAVLFTSSYPLCARPPPPGASMGGAFFIGAVGGVAAAAALKTSTALLELHFESAFWSK